MAEFFGDLFSFSTPTHIVRFVCIVLILLIIVYEVTRVIVKAVKKKKATETPVAESVDGTGVTPVAEGEIAVNPVTEEKEQTNDDK